MKLARAMGPERSTPLPVWRPVVARRARRGLRPLALSVTAQRCPGALVLLALLMGWRAGLAPALAQPITGTLGAPGATAPISGNQPPAPAAPSEGFLSGGMDRDPATNGELGR
jgi:hypothetical protein